MNEYDRELLKLRIQRILSSRASAIAIATLGTFTTVALAIQGSSTPPPAPVATLTSAEGAPTSENDRPSIFDVPAKYREKLLALPSPSSLKTRFTPRNRDAKAFEKDNATISFTPRPLFPLAGFGRNSRTSPPAENEGQFHRNSTSKRNAKFLIPAHLAAQPLPVSPSATPTPQPELSLSPVDAIALSLVPETETARAYLGSRTAATTVQLNEKLALKIPAVTALNSERGTLPGEAEADPQFRSLSQQIVSQLQESAPLDAGDDQAVQHAALLTAVSERLAVRQGLEERIAEAGVAYRNLLQAQARVAIEAAALDRARRHSLQPSEARWQEAKAALDRVRTELSARFKLGGALPVAAVAPRTIQAFDLDEGALQQFMLANRPDYLQSQLEVERAKIALQHAENLSVAAADKESTDKGRSADDSEAEIEAYRQAVLGAEHSRELLAQRLQLELSDRIRELDLNFKQLQLAREVRQRAEEAPTEGLQGRELERWHGDLVSAQQDELNVTIACLNAIARLDLALGNSLNRWGVEVTAR